MPSGVYLRKSIPVSERFAAMVSPEPNSGCWLWLGCVDPNGYARMYDGVSGGRPVHQVAYEIHKGPIPENLHIDHRCRVRCCVNPNHLEAVTQLENTRRGHGLAVVNAAKTHCPAGHLYSDGNTYHYALGGRTCRVCHAIYVKRYHDRKRLGQCHL